MSAAGARASRGVVDTSTAVRLSPISDPGILPAEPLITTVTLAELSAGSLVAADDRERSVRPAHLQQAEASRTTTWPPEAGGCAEVLGWTVPGRGESPPRLPVAFDAVLIELRVVADDAQPFDQCLGDQESVERVAVVAQRQIGHSPGVLGGDVERGEEIGRAHV